MATAMAAPHPPTRCAEEHRSDDHNNADETITLDATLWGELQHHLPLATIFAKLPLAAFFRLRQVCRHWNRLASDRAFLESSFRPPISSHLYFIVSNRITGHHRLLTAEFHRWASSPLPPARCEVSGLLYEDSDRNRVFDVHTRVFHALPDVPALQVPELPMDEEEDYADPLVAMIVDDSAKPYNFRVILADEVVGTRIYDSKSGEWTHKPSTYEYTTAVEGTQSCVYYDGVLYIRVCVYGAEFDMHSYVLETDEWDCLMPGAPESVGGFCDIGLWRGRLFGFGMRSVITAWELTNRFEDQWTQVDCMPGGLCSWILGEEVQGVDRYVNLQSKFCGAYVLVYNCVGGMERAVLYNLDRKTWEKVELPGPCLVSNLC